MATLEAGRELDALVAEKVFGWRREPQPNGVIITELWFEPDGRQHLATGVPHFSTDVAAAWQVVEDLGRKGHFVLIEGPGAGLGASQRWRCAIDPERDGDSDKNGYGETASLAICRAALEAVEAANSDATRVQSSC